jgi:hypothetical protein
MLFMMDDLHRPAKLGVGGGDVGPGVAQCATPAPFISSHTHLSWRSLSTVNGMLPPCMHNSRCKKNCVKNENRVCKILQCIFLSCFFFVCFVVVVVSRGGVETLIYNVIF